jgi:hypothetical protein
MPREVRKVVRKAPRKIALQKARASEILAGLDASSYEKKYVKKVLASAKSPAPERESFRKVSELRVSRKTLKSGTK